jgi:CMP-N,N'-diacetyllegionaminic acid synthase
MTKPAAELKAIALVPARSGSKRLPHKNIQPLNGHPLIAYSICAARASGVFAAVAVMTDSAEYADIAAHYGATTPFLREADISADTSPDIEWVRAAIEHLDQSGVMFDCFSILRPTSPFRKPETIRRAWDKFVATPGIDSLRAVEKVTQHPGKMWVVRDDRLFPLMPLTPAEAPWHSQQYAALPTVYVQNASLEIAWSRVVRESGTIAGSKLIPFFTERDEGIDINSVEDLWHANYLLGRGEAVLPLVDRVAYAKERLPVGVV